ncbi:9147_t:CDS:2 [Ambispora gerdemannii]|uniref:9147_t:CDS:1 n=1 Tax=Ambispora gerdemannii TaxID=144530 RepID=A0A9N8UXK4_9GLOM|nr:9147_t:CDS:2 [Ambispora gerdemannii]
MEEQKAQIQLKQEENNYLQSNQESDSTQQRLDDQDARPSQPNVTTDNVIAGEGIVKVEQHTKEEQETITTNNGQNDNALMVSRMRGQDSPTQMHSITTTDTPPPEEENVRVFVGSLAWEVNDNDLKRRFSEFGEVREAVVVRDKSNGNKGYGFVTYYDAESAAKAVNGMVNESIGGRSVRIEFAEVRYRPRHRDSDSWSSSQHRELTSPVRHRSTEDNIEREVAIRLQNINEDSHVALISPSIRHQGEDEHTQESSSSMRDRSSEKEHSRTSLTYNNRSRSYLEDNPELSLKYRGDLDDRGYARDRYFSSNEYTRERYYVRERVHVSGGSYPIRERLNEKERDGFLKNRERAHEFEHIRDSREVINSDKLARDEYVTGEHICIKDYPGDYDQSGSSVHDNRNNDNKEQGSRIEQLNESAGQIVTAAEIVGRPEEGTEKFIEAKGENQIHDKKKEQLTLTRSNSVAVLDYNESIPQHKLSENRNENEWYADKKFRFNRDPQLDQRGNLDYFRGRGRDQRIEFEDNVNFWNVNYSRESERVSVPYHEHPKQHAFVRPPYYEYGRQNERRRVSHIDFPRITEYKAREAIERERSRDHDLRERERYHRDYELDAYHRGSPITNNNITYRDPASKRVPYDYYYSSSVMPRTARRSISPRRPNVRRSLSPRGNNYSLRRSLSPRRPLPVPPYNKGRYNKYEGSGIRNSNNHYYQESRQRIPLDTNESTMEPENYKPIINGQDEISNDSRHWDSKITDTLAEHSIGSTSTIVASISGAPAAVPPYEMNTEQAHESTTNSGHQDSRYWNDVKKEVNDSNVEVTSKPQQKDSRESERYHLWNTETDARLQNIERGHREGGGSGVNSEIEYKFGAHKQAGYERERHDRNWEMDLESERPITHKKEFINDPKHRMTDYQDDLRREQ